MGLEEFDTSISISFPFLHFPFEPDITGERKEEGERKGVKGNTLKKNGLRKKRGLMNVGIKKS